MAALILFECFAEDLCEKVHNLDTDTLKVYLCNTAPNVATHKVKADLAEITTTTDNPAGGKDIQAVTSRTGGVTTVSGSDITWAWTVGSGTGTFRYLVLYNDTATNDPLVGYWDYGTTFNANEPGESFLLDLGSSFLTIS